MSGGGRGLTRRTALAIGGAAAASALLAEPFAWAAGKSGLHGLSVFGELKYPVDFKNFDYANLAAPKGGRINFQPGFRYYNQNFSTFNTLNAFVLKGDAPPRMEFVFDSLMATAGDEPDSHYGLVAETVDVSEDTNIFTFHLRRDARFHDGSPLTAEDVAFSLMLLKEKGHPNLTVVLEPVARAEATGPTTVVVTLDGTQNRETILSVAGMPIFSAAYYTANAFDSSTLEAPLGSGPYMVGDLAAGRYIEYRRVQDYWGRDLPVNVGFFNFDVIRIDFFRERQTQFEAFKKGDITFREEFTSATWAKEYTFPAVVDGRVKQTLFPDEKRPGLQSFFFNTRTKKFADPRTRLAIGLAFDFEWSNRNLFFEAYQRQFSYFQKSDFMAEGPPGPEELALLEPYRADLPAEVFGEPYVPPKTDGSGRDRGVLKRASDLLIEAGWKQIGDQIVDAEGAPLTFEFLIDAQVFERILSPWTESLKAIGVTSTIRQVDPAQYAQRLNGFDFDVVLAAWGFLATPLDGWDSLFGSKAADTPGSDNLAGIKVTAVDGLIARFKDVTNREELVALLRALDRVLRAGYYVVPSWYSANHRVAHWDIFGWPEKKPDYNPFAPEATWWFDADKARAIGYAG